MPRRPGRPARDTPVLQPGRILDEAAALIADKGVQKFSMRGLARRLSVDPMALYHHFPGRDALLAAAADHVFAKLSPDFSGEQDWQARLDALAEAYLDLCWQHQGLLAALVQGDIVPASVALRFDGILAEALRGLPLPEERRPAVRNAVADLLHGVALSADRSDQWRGGFSVLVAGIEAIALRRPAGSP